MMRRARMGIPWENVYGHKVLGRAIAVRQPIKNGVAKGDPDSASRGETHGRLTR